VVEVVVAILLVTLLLGYLEVLAAVQAVLVTV
jgi:hypothetical protein